MNYTNNNGNNHTDKERHLREEFDQLIDDFTETINDLDAFDEEQPGENIDEIEWEKKEPDKK